MNISDLFKTLGDENRLRIINLLLRGELCVCQIERIMTINQSNASRHLLKLKNTGIVRTTKKAQWVYYSLSTTFEEEHSILTHYIKDQLKDVEPFASDLVALNKVISCGDCYQDV
ncbi:ArsR/SmtB family transcription factor [Vallitalea okinawensis]|uniref:ArsR/SmtB family transcription factor n=1 Tax=Vallitalea okinawensis TaxID=2078660 RepID=UPI000CFBD584|nr:metalloregulator ArsR/SmtB family transcription factor [Vallitalea okinawensis]